MAAVTRAQERVLEAVREITADGFPATVREVGAVAGLASPSTTFAHLQNLELTGHVARSARRSRSGWLPSSNAGVSGQCYAATERAVTLGKAGKWPLIDKAAYRCELDAGHAGPHIGDGFSW